MTIGNCPHGEFKKGCDKCIVERRKEFEASQHPQTLLNIVKVQYYSQSTGEISPREYTYYSVDRLKVDDKVTVPVRDTTTQAMVTAIDIPDSEIASFKDKVKTIPAGSIIKVRPEQEELEEGLNAEGFTLRQPLPLLDMPTSD